MRRSVLSHIWRSCLFLYPDKSLHCGRGIALKLAENGAAKICINYLSQESEAQQTLDKVRELGADGFICKADVSIPAEIQNMYEQIKREFGTLDVMVSDREYLRQSH